MNIMRKLLVVGMLAFVASLSSVKVTAQNRPDPEQFRQRMMDRYREMMGVKDDAEWKLISERITKVMDARREVGFGGGAMFGRGRGGGGNDQAQGGGNGGRRGGRGLFGEPSPEAEALQKAIDSDASADDIKAKLAKYRESRKEKRANLEKAQEDLKSVLSAKQEAAAVLGGLLE
jgi:hypothetical protein